ncbi:MAG: DMT family transporter [Clostridiales bacterium]|nr:DMT family transporter [Clostridiales bacterium]
MEAGLSRSASAGIARIAIAATVWGSIAIFVRGAESHPAVVVFWRVAFAALAIGAYLAFRGRLGELMALPPRTKLIIAGMGVLLTLNWVLFLAALSLTKVAVAVLLGYCGPIIVAVLNPIIARQPFDARIVAPLALALGGTAIIVGPQNIALQEGTHLLGAGLALASAITYALLIVIVKQLLKDIPASTYMFGEYLVAMLVLLPAVLLLDGPATLLQWGSVATLGIVHTAFTGALFLTGLRLVRADHAAIITYAEPVSAVLFAAAFLGERIGLFTIAGGALVIIGGLIVARLKPAAATVEGPPVPVQATDTPPGTAAR